MTHLPDLHEIDRQLAAVDATLVAPAARDVARRQGREGPGGDALLGEALGLARRNPPLAVSLALGAAEASQPAAGLALGIALNWWGRFAQALPFTEQAPESPTPYARRVRRWVGLVAARRLRPTPHATEALLGVADRLEADGDRVDAHRCRLEAAPMLPAAAAGQALALIRAARALFAAEGLPHDDAIAESIEAQVLIAGGQIDAGTGHLLAAEAAFTALEMPAMQAYAWLWRGILARQQRRADEALHWLSRARDRALALGQAYYAVLAVLEIAGLKANQGEVDASMATHAAHVELLQGSAIAGAEADRLLTAGIWHFERGSLPQAEQHLAEARTIYERLGNDRFAAICTLNLGHVARRQGDFGRSLRLLRQAAEVFEAGGHLEDLSHAHHGLGATFTAFGYAEPAVEHLETARALAERAGGEGLAAGPSILLARLMGDRGEWSPAVKLLERVEGRAAAFGIHRDAALSRRVRADVLLGAGRPDEALADYALSRDRFAALGHVESAREARLGMAAARLAQGDLAAAAVELAELPPAELPRVLRWRYHAIAARQAQLSGRSAAALGDFTAALGELRAARRSLENEDQAQQLVLTLRPLYEQAFALAIEQDDPARALRIAELYGAQMIDVRLGAPFAPSPAVSEPAESNYDSLRAALSRRLGRAWTVLRYAWHDGGLWAFTLTPDDLSCEPIPLDARARLALKLCASPDDSFRQRAYFDRTRGGLGVDARRALFERLLPASVRDGLSPAHTLIVVPSGQLYGLAFGALLDGDMPLIGRAVIGLTPSLELLERLLSAQPAHLPGSPGLVLAQSHFTRPGYRDLPHVEREATAVLESAPGPARRLGGLDMRRSGSEVFAGVGWMHLATHAAADPATGAFTGLVVGDEVLHLADIQHWHIDAGLVVLSACQTGLGRWYFGDEVAGLQQAFLSAGARSVIASLWMTADDRTADLMGDLYHHMAAGERPAAALAGAQRAAARAGMPAYYWAPFSAAGAP